MSVAGAQTPEAPDEILVASLDARGRVRIRDSVYQFLVGFGDSKYFITSFDLRTVLIYPMSQWLLNKQVLENSEEYAEAGRRLLFLARLRGHTTEFDEEQRLLLPFRLRQQMGLDGKQRVFLNCYRGHVELLPEQTVESMETDYQDHVGTDLAAFQGKLR